ncbi:MAG TPA: Hsp20/alpha crystallin family protein [Vicinamibacterales bacterium]|nr:Hsp20/alpha crystallin family protein [Vicinamibacterales bacterium]
MFGTTRWSPFEELFNVQREVDRLFNRFWSDLPTRAESASPGTFQVKSDEDGWRVEVPMPGIDPRYVTLEVAGNTLNIRAEVPGDAEGKDKRAAMRYEQSLSLPQFLDLDKLTATNRHGMLELKVPLKESVKPRRVEIQSTGEEQKQLTTSSV